MSRERTPFGSFDPNEIYQRLIEEGEAWADANAAADLLEETRKTLLGQLTATIMRIEGVAYNAAEAKARGSDEYQKHIRSQVLARRDADKLRVRYDAARMWAELLRTKAANLRTEMQLAGMQA